MKNKYLNLLILIGIMVSCKEPLPELPEKYELKDKSKTRIEGQVLEYGSNKPLPYAKVVLRESIFPPFSGGGNYIPIDTFEADVEGKFIIEFKHLESTASYLVAYDIYCEEFWYYPDTKNMEKGYGHRRNLVLDPYGWIKIHIKNIKPFDKNDYCFISTGGGGSQQQEL